VKKTGTDNSAWWYQFGFASMADLNNYGLQVASRPIDITTYVSNGVRRYDAVFIDNANASTRRMRDLLGQTFLDANGNPTKGIFESYLKQVNGAVKVDLNSTRRAETASSLKSLHLLRSMGRSRPPGHAALGLHLQVRHERRQGRLPGPVKGDRRQRRFNYNFEKGLDEMMRISDNRTTRGFRAALWRHLPPFNNTAVASDDRHDAAPQHRLRLLELHDPEVRPDEPPQRHDRLRSGPYLRGVWNQTLLTNTNSARDEFLESANPAAA
jgi:hypothetical protein